MKHCILLLLLLTGCATRQPVFFPWPPVESRPVVPVVAPEAPKARPAPMPTPAPRRSGESKVALLPLPISMDITDAMRAPAALSTTATDKEDTNSVFSVTLGWNYTNTVQTFRLWEGPAPGFYTNVIATGTSNSFTICRTNWPEEGRRHYYAVTAVKPLGLESAYSNEIFWPPFPPSHYRLRWTNSAPGQIISSTTLSAPYTNWPVYAMVGGVTNYEAAMNSRERFFMMRRQSGQQDHLFISSWNPLNAPLNDPRF